MHYFNTLVLVISFWASMQVGAVCRTSASLIPLNQTPFSDEKSVFTEFTGGVSFGVHKDSAAWIKFECSGKFIDDVVSIDYGHLDYVTVYSQYGDLLVENLGDHGGFSHRFVKMQSPNFVIDDRFGATFFVKAINEGSLNLPIRIMDREAFQSASLMEFLFYGSFFGLLSGLALYNLFLFATLRRKVYAFYVLYVVSSILTQANLSGFLGAYVWPTAGSWMNKSVIFCFILFWLSTSLFTIDYLKLTKHSQTLYRLFLSMIATCFVLALFSIFAEYSFAIKIVQYLIIIISVLKIISGVMVWRKGYEPAKYFTISWSFFMVANIITTLRDMGHIDPSFIVNHLSMAGSVTEVILLSLGLGSYIRSVENERRGFEKRADDLTAISHAMQMIAHDVRKPFAIMTNTMDVLSKAHGENIKQLAEQFLPDVQKTLKEVSGLFDDVIAIGDEHHLNDSEQSIYDLIKESLAKNSTSRVGLDIELKYQLKHKNMLYVDANKVGRIFSNIIENAIQAQNGGSIWFTSDEDEKDISIKIGNSGSFIPPEDRKRIFDMFFTKGKVKGTGLGLAIVERFVQLHGGKISCRSDKDSGTEFIFNLPKSNKPDPLATMPAKLSEVSPMTLPINVMQPADDGPQIEDMMRKVVEGPTLRILVIDDEPIYQKLLLELVPSDVKTVVTIDVSGSPSEARAFLSQGEYDLLIIDADLGKNQITGFDFLDEVKDGTFIKVIHTNRSEASFSKKSYEKGADYFLAKPMTRAHFIRFMWEASMHKTDQNREIIIIDDEPDLLRPALMALGSRFKVTIFTSVDALFDELDKEGSAVDFNKISHILVDRFIGRSDSLKQNIPDNLRKYGYLNKIIMFSNSVREGVELPSGYDGMTSKDVVEMRKLFE